MNLTYTITFILAFCSIVYELLLGQTLSAFLGNTVLRYSITIALYMFSMGIGAFFAEGRLLKNPFLTLLRTEVLIIICGGLSIIHMHYINYLFNQSAVALSIFSHLLIIVIGILTGLELPVLMEIQNYRNRNTENIVLGINYSGAFFGTIVFAFWFYPKMGLMPAAFFIGILNAFASLLLMSQTNKVSLTRPGPGTKWSYRSGGQITCDPFVYMFSKGPRSKKAYKFLYSLHFLFLILFITAFMHSSEINTYFMEMYIEIR